LPKDNEKIHQFDSGPVTPSEVRAFSPDQMVKCSACDRSNPPTRANCLYCGAPLTLAEQISPPPKLNLRPLEPGEVGFNTVLIPGDDLVEMSAAASFLKLPEDSLQTILHARLPLPVARTASYDEAKLVEATLQQINLRSLIISDSDLKVEESPPTRVRAAQISETEIVLYQVTSEEKWRVQWSNLKLLLIGRLTTKRLVSKERRASGGENEIIDASETQSDESVVDLYDNENSRSFRVAANSFDFSCLGNRKGLIANENFERLVSLILERAPSAKLDKSYKSVRQALEFVWPGERQSHSTGWRREGLGKVTLGAIIETSNERQFSRYSRLRWYLDQHHEA
jgi:hypothetical protein